MLNVLFSAAPKDWEKYRDALVTALAGAGLQVDLARDHAPETVDYIVYAPSGATLDFTPYLRCKAVLSLWAGVETIVTNPTLTQPLTRMVDPGMTAGMVEYVCGHVLRHHLGMDADIMRADRQWQPHDPPLAADRPVTVLGLGALGLACAQALVGLGFPVTGWSRTAKSAPGLRCLHGEAGLRDALTGAQIVVLLLPDTAATRDILNAQTLALPASGAVVINPGRGTLIDDAALLATLDSGQIGHATLDAFRTEPLPANDPYWGHPHVTITPHIASGTRPRTAAEVIADNIRRGEAGQSLRHLVGRERGY
jgi:glyoxylate/hydroxypyruvate reductase A